jgi:cytochrome c
MFKAALFVIALAACGGKSKPAAPVETKEAAVTETPKEAPPPEEAKPEVPDPSVLAAAALAEQYDAGKTIYAAKACNSCHGDSGEGNPKTPVVIGEKAFPEKAAKTAKLRKTIKFTTAKDVMDFVKAKMPIKAPNTLTDDEAAAVTAWMLSESKVNITEKLDPTNAASVNLR